MSETAELGELARKDSKAILPRMPKRLPNVAITGASYDTGMLVIPIEKKVRAVTADESKVQEKILTATKGLKLISTTVANKGETPITFATMAEVKLNLASGTKADGTTELIVGTENPRGVSSSDAGPVIDNYGKISRRLKTHGIKIGELDNVESATHTQSACVSVVAQIHKIARTKTVAGRTDIIGHAKAYYAFPSDEDLTGAVGAADIRIDKTRKGLVLLPFVGREGGARPDFDKLINVFSTVEKTGVSQISEYPIVFGKYSEYVKMYDVFGAMGKSLKKAGININKISPDEFFEKFIIVPHIPHPQMPEKELANLIEHFMHQDQGYSKKVLTEIANHLEANPKDKKPEYDPANKQEYDWTHIPYVDGLKSQRESFRFIADVGGLVLTLEQAKKSFAITNKDPNSRIENFVDIRDVATVVAEEIKEFKESFGISSRRKKELNRLFAVAEEKLETIIKDGGTLDSVIATFSEIYEDKKDSKAMINRFMEADRYFGSLVRKTATYKDLYKKAHMEEVSYLAKRTGNIYPGSAPLALVSTLAKVEPEELVNKVLLLVGYGSGDEAYSVMLMPNDLPTIRKMHIVAQRMIEFDEKHKIPITKEEYTKLRTEKDVRDFVRVVPLLKDTIPGFNMPKIDRDGVVEFARAFSDFIQTGVFENAKELRSVQRSEKKILVSVSRGSEEMSKEIVVRNQRKRVS